MSERANQSHTQQEILSQPLIWEKTLKDWATLDADAFPRQNQYDQVLFIGCGSTYYLSRWAARMNESLKGVISRAAPSSDLILYPSAWLNKNRKTLLIASSRSAATTETIRAIDIFKNNYPGDVIVVTCHPEKQMGSQSQHVISAIHAQEKSIAQTRSFSSMMLAHAWLIDRAIPDKVVVQLRESGKRILNEYQELIITIAKNDQFQRFFFLGSGPVNGLANECMLKMKEVSLSYSESFHTMEFRHGPMSMVDSSSLVIGLLGENAIEKELAVLREMKSKGARTLAIAEKTPTPKNVADDLILLKSALPLLWRSVLYLPAMQDLAYERGIFKGLDPDKPHNLDAVVVLNE